jgi:hypothetical protein
MEKMTGAEMLRLHSKLRASVLKFSSGGDDWMLLVLSLHLEGAPLIDCYGFARMAKLLLGDMQRQYSDMDLRDAFELCDHNRSRYATLTIEDAILFTLMPTPQARLRLPSHVDEFPIHTLHVSAAVNDRRAALVLTGFDFGPVGPQLAAPGVVPILP